MYAGCAGRLVHAPNGMKIAFLPERTSSSLAMGLEMRRFESSKSVKLSPTFGSATTAHMAIGVSFMDPTSAKSAITTFPNTFLNADNAGSGLVTDAEEIDFEVAMLKT